MNKYRQVRVSPWMDPILIGIFLYLTKMFLSEYCV